jgi:phosphatidylserine/phosphatidylglycerophosphate/cardiolipin synthase-like enzyme
MALAALFCFECPLWGRKISPGTGEIVKQLSFSPDKLNSHTAVYSLENGGKSLLARLWLIEHAQKSIDIQYFSFAKDVTGLIVNDYIVRAAERGVKVRILLDDAASKMYSHQVRLLDSHENIEIHVYNAGVKLGRLDKRVPKTAKNIARLMRRMHNKTLCIDGQVAMLGGRNISDDYFDYHKKFNFRDRDILLAGKATGDITASFEKFWTHELSVPFSELSRKSKKKRYQDTDRFDELHEDASKTKKFREETRRKITEFAAEIKDAQKNGLVTWIRDLSFISDVPGKNLDRESRRGGITNDSILVLLAQAKKSIIIQSPYFIPTDDMRKAMKDAIDRGVKIRVLTNSLASIDIATAFSAYKKLRADLLQMGLIIHEYKPDPQIRYSIMIPDIQREIKYKADFGLHSKTILIDDHTTVIGSYNMDPRSANFNTECVSVLRSEEFAKDLSIVLEQEFLEENSWHVTTEFNPDRKAKLGKRIKAVLTYPVPKKML